MPRKQLTESQLKIQTLREGLEKTGLRSVSSQRLNKKPIVAVHYRDGSQLWVNDGVRPHGGYVLHCQLKGMTAEEIIALAKCLEPYLDAVIGA